MSHQLGDDSALLRACSSFEHRDQREYAGCGVLFLPLMKCPVAWRVKLLVSAQSFPLGLEPDWLSAVGALPRRRHQDGFLCRGLCSRSERRRLGDERLPCGDPLSAFGMGADPFNRAWLTKSWAADPAPCGLNVLPAQQLLLFECQFSEGGVHDLLRVGVWVLAQREMRPWAPYASKEHLRWELHGINDGAETTVAARTALRAQR
jgi:hypothetical protein